MTDKEAEDLAFEKTIEYIRSVNVSVDEKTLSLIARAIGNYQRHYDTLKLEITKGRTE